MLFNLPDHATLYNALLNRDAAFDGRVYVCVKTTGIFCRLTCPARNPKKDNCRFVETIAECITTGFRPCKRCNPLAPEAQADKTIQLLLAKLQAEPGRRWLEKDIVQLGLDPSTVRRSFKRQYGVTFLEMARQSRLREGFSELANGNRVIDAQVSAGFSSASAFRHAFAKLLGFAPSQFSDKAPLKADWIDTPLGAMVAVCDTRHLHLLEFSDRKALPAELKRLCKTTTANPAPIGFGRTGVTEKITTELNDFFELRNARFTVPVAMHATPFTQSVWQALQKIPAGQTRSYSQIAHAVGKPAAVRAVARANGANPIAIVIPCHRVIGADGSLTGYGGGLWRKQYLINLETRYSEKQPSAGQIHRYYN